MDDEPLGRDFDELDDLREVPEPDTGIPGSEVRGSINDEDLFEFDPGMDVGIELAPPGIGGGGIASVIPPGGGVSPGSGYVPPSSDDYVVGSGFLGDFAEVLNNDSSPFAVSFDWEENSAMVYRPDGKLYVEETGEGLMFQYVGDNFADPDYPASVKAFSGQNLDIGEVRIGDETFDEEFESAYSGRELESGSYRFLFSDDTPFDMRVDGIGSTILGIRFEMTNKGDVREFSEVFGAVNYEGDFNRDYEDL